jgi:hypothetical protein
MHKVVSRLDDERPQALIEVVDLCTAMASAGLIVSILKVLVELITEPAQPLAGDFRSALFELGTKLSFSPWRCAMKQDPIDEQAAKEAQPTEAERNYGAITAG